MIPKILTYLFGSLDNTGNGASARKLATFTAIITGVILSIKDGDSNNVAILVGIWLTYACLNSGLVTYQQLINAKLNKTDTIIQTSTTSDTIIKTNV